MNERIKRTNKRMEERINKKTKKLRMKERKRMIETISYT